MKNQLPLKMSLMKAKTTLTKKVRRKCKIFSYLNEFSSTESTEEKVRAKRSIPDEGENAQSDEQESTQKDDDDSQEKASNDSVADNESQENTAEGQEDGNESESQENAEASQEGSEQESEEAEEEEQEPQPEEDLTMEFEIPKNLRSRGHVSDLLGLDAESSIKG